MFTTQNKKAKIVINPHMLLIGDSIKSQLAKQTLIKSMFFGNEIDQLIAKIVHKVDCFRLSPDNVEVKNILFGKGSVSLVLIKNNGMINIEALIN